MFEDFKTKSIFDCHKKTSLSQFAKKYNLSSSASLSFEIHECIDEIKEQWDQLVPKEWFYSSAYQTVLERTNPNNINNLYVIVYNGDQAIGGMLLQHVILRTKTSFNYEQYSTDHSWLSRTWQKFSQWVVSRFTFKMMTIGSLYLTGNYGILLPDSWSSDRQFLVTQEITTKLKKILANSPYKFDGQLYKDIPAIEQPSAEVTKSLVTFKIDPNMILQLNPSWLNFDDYLLDMKSKYRVRMRSALKKAKDVVKRDMTEEEVRNNQSAMYALYSSVLEGSGFVLAQGKEDYFTRLKEKFGSAYQVTGYWLNGELVGFYTWVLEGSKMDTHFIGFRHDLNNRYQLYLNILLDLVKDGINAGAKSIYFFRTALEIKSSVGAEPHDLMVYFKHNNTWFNNWIIKRFFTSFVPSQSWDQRHPFKDSGLDDD